MSNWFEKQLLDPEGKEFIDEAYVPIGLAVFLIVACWIASR